MADEASGAEEHKKKGNEAFKEQKWDEAIKHYNKAIALDPDQAAFYSNRAACWSSKGNHESALNDAKKCIERDRNFVKGYSRKGKALFDLNKLDEAEAAYKEGLAADSNNEACKAGLVTIQGARRAASARSSASAGTGLPGLDGVGRFAKAAMEKMKSGGIGGRLQMYMFMMAAMYLYKTYTGDSSGKSSTKSSHETAQDDDGDSAEGTQAGALRRGFKDIGGSWISYLEAEGSAETLLLMLHRSASSAEVDFGTTMSQLMAGPQPASGMLKVLAPDRPCHGYSPCPSAGEPEDANLWLGRLVATRHRQRLALVASGREAMAQAIAFLGTREEAAQVLIVSPRAATPSRGSLSTAGELADWLRSSHPGRTATAAAAASAAQWAVTGAGAKGAAEDASAAPDLPDFPKGTAFTLLYAEGEVEDDAFKAALEDQGIEVRTRSEAPRNLIEATVSEIRQMLGINDDADL